MTKKSLYAPIDPIERGRLKVSALHDIYYEVSGHPNGKPVIVCHGGPGGGSTPSMRRFFDPERYKIILFDQRGCGRSTPHAELRDNTTWDLVADIEKLREHLKIDRWQVFGGSWGATLALAYALTHPDQVMELVLRGIFTLRQSELDWFYKEGASWIHPEAWEKFLQPIPGNERDHLISAYYQRLTSPDKSVQIEAAQAWAIWEGSTVSLHPSPQRIQGFSNEHFAHAFARIECHYFINRGFFEYDGWILDHAHRLTSIPGIIVQGRYDVVTPPKTAWQLHRAWLGSVLNIVPDAGHAAGEDGTIAELVKATDLFADRQ